MIDLKNCEDVRELNRAIKERLNAKIIDLSSYLQSSPQIKERELYQRTLDQYRSNVATYAYEYQQGFEEGFQIGLARRKARGIEIGEARGIEIGEARERQKAYEEKLATAKALKSIGKLSVAEIAAATGLTTSDIEAL